MHGVLIKLTGRQFEPTHSLRGSKQFLLLLFKRRLLLPRATFGLLTFTASAGSSKKTLLVSSYLLELRFELGLLCACKTITGMLDEMPMRPMVVLTLTCSAISSNVHA